MEYISLGSTCCIAFKLQKLQKEFPDESYRKCSYPFDWIRINNFKDILNCLINNLAFFVESCQEINKSDKFKIFSDDDFPELDVDKNQSFVMNNKYNFKFYHDFHIGCDISQIVDKYNRRISRFFSVIKQESKKVCFLREEINPKMINYENYEQFMDLIKKINPNLKFILIVIVHNPKNICIPIKVINKNIYIVENTLEFEDWTRPNLDLRQILKSKTFY